MAGFTLTRRALSDLKSIAAYTQRKWGRAQRQFYVLQIDEVFHLLANSSALGQNCDFIKPGYRKFPVGSHLVFYRNAGDSGIEVVRVLHKRMDAGELLKGP
jgi:toxin ParE1/3/4